MSFQKPKLAYHRKMGLLRCATCNQLVDKRDIAIHVCYLPCAKCGIGIRIGEETAHQLECNPIKASRDRAVMSATMGKLNGFFVKARA